MTEMFELPPKESRISLRSWLTLLAAAPVTAWIGLVILLFYGVVVIFAGVLAPFGEAEIASSQSFEEWNSVTLLGTDQLGRDMLSRLIYAARNTIGLALATTLLSFSLGSTSGMLAAILGGWFDQFLSRVVDVMMSIPSIISALILLSIFGSGLFNLVIIIAVLDATRVFRLTRAVSLGVVVTDFVEVARLRGERTPWIIRHEILPNILPTLLAEFGMRFCFVFLSISALSFLGIGIQPPTADWGSMVRETATLISYGDVTPLLPAFAIALLTVGVNFVVDWLLERSSGLTDE